MEGGRDGAARLRRLGQLDLPDATQLSWMHRDYKWFAKLTYDNRGLFYTQDYYTACADQSSMAACLNPGKVKTWARAYATAVAGLVQAFSVSVATRVATLMYAVDTKATGPTTLSASMA